MTCLRTKIICRLDVGFSSKFSARQECQMTYLPWQNFTCPFTYHAMNFGMDTIWQNDVSVSYMIGVLIKGITLLAEN